MGGSAFSIPKGSPHADLTYQVIKYVLTTPKNLPITARMGSQFVSRMDYWKFGVPPANKVDPKRFKHTFYDPGHYLCQRHTHSFCYRFWFDRMCCPGKLGSYLRRDWNANLRRLGGTSTN